MAQTYRLFLLGFHDQLTEAIGDAENAGWHHLGAESEEWQHYVRLATWEKEIYERMVIYAAAKNRSAWRKLRRGTPPDASTRDLLGRPGDRPELSG